MTTTLDSRVSSTHGFPVPPPESLFWLSTYLWSEGLYSIPCFFICPRSFFNQESIFVLTCFPFYLSGSLLAYNTTSSHTDQSSRLSVKEGELPKHHQHSPSLSSGTQGPQVGVQAPLILMNKIRQQAVTVYAI